MEINVLGIRRPNGAARRGTRYPFGGGFDFRCEAAQVPWPNLGQSLRVESLALVCWLDNHLRARRGGGGGSGKFPSTFSSARSGYLVLSKRAKRSPSPLPNRSGWNPSPGFRVSWWA